MENQILNALTGNNPVILQVSMGDLKELFRLTYAEEQKRIADALLHHRETPELTRKETAKRLGVSLATLWKWAKEGYLVPAKIGTKVMYRASDVDALLERNLAK